VSARGVRRWAILAIGGSVAGVAGMAGTAGAQGEALTVRGSVGGELARGGQTRFAITATHPDGWQALRTVGVTLELHGAVLEEVTYEVDGTAIEVGGNRAVAGTGNIAEGRFFRVGAFGVEVSTGGDRLRLTFGARVLEDPPARARLRFAVEDDEGEAADMTVVAAAAEEDGGFSVLAVAGAAVAALLAGGFLGSRLTTRRRAAPSVYASVARRLAESERPPPGPERR
jgi:hypothetical protein